MVKFLFSVDTITEAKQSKAKQSNRQGWARAGARAVDLPARSCHLKRGHWYISILFCLLSAVISVNKGFVKYTCRGTATAKICQRVATLVYADKQVRDTWKVKHVVKGQAFRTPMPSAVRPLTKIWNRATVSHEAQDYARTQLALAKWNKIAEALWFCVVNTLKFPSTVALQTWRWHWEMYGVSLSLYQCSFRFT